MTQYHSTTVTDDLEPLSCLTLSCVLRPPLGIWDHQEEDAGGRVPAGPGDAGQRRAGSHDRSGPPAAEWRGQVHQRHKEAPAEHPADGDGQRSGQRSSESVGLPGLPAGERITFRAFSVPLDTAHKDVLYWQVFANMLLMLCFWTLMN